MGAGVVGAAVVGAGVVGAGVSSTNGIFAGKGPGVVGISRMSDAWQSVQEETSSGAR